MENEKSLVAASYSVERIREQMDNVHRLMKEVMKEGEHYGIIPGTDKKTLYKQGAEKLSMMFRLAPKYKIEKTEMPNGHREINFSCLIIHIPSQTIMAEGVGSCSTMESKFRYRNISGFEVTDMEIPKDSKENKAMYRKQGFGMKKVEGAWCWVKFKGGERQENPDIADVYNTVLKMAKKRAHIDAVLTATGASDIFTQDYEPDEDQPPLPQYETVAAAMQKLRLCDNLIDLENLSSQYKTDWKNGITGWTGDQWNGLVSVIKGQKKDLEERFESSIDGEAEPQKEEPPQNEPPQDKGKPDQIEADWY